MKINLKTITLAYSQLKNDNRKEKMSNRIKSLQKPDIKTFSQTNFWNRLLKWRLMAFAKKNQHVPKIDQDYKFDRDTTLAILSGFAFNKRVLNTRISWYWKIYTHRASSCKIKLAVR